MSTKSGLFDGVNARLCIDQYGQHAYARTLKELREASGHGSSPQKMYLDFIKGEHAGTTRHVGYVIGPRWYHVYAPVTAEA